jgi:hypothetical protein
MRPVRGFGPSFRIIIAMVFGFMSLAHGPVMAFAQEQAPQAQHQPAAHHAGHPAQHTGHHRIAAEHAQGHHHAVTPATGSTAICYASGCFVAVAPLPIGAPANASFPLQQLAPAPARAIVPAELDPAVPPPRLQA